MTRDEFRAAVEAAVRERDDNMGKADPMAATIDAIEAAAEEWHESQNEPSDADPCAGPCCTGGI